MSSTEHKFVCDLLVKSLEDLTSVVVYLNSNECPNISSAAKKISDSILNDGIIESIDLDEDQINRYTLGMLFKMYEEQIIRKNTDNFCQPIVLFFDQIESFDYSVLSSLIMIMKEYIETIPFIILLSTSNQSTSLQYLLPATATDCLLIQLFNSIPQNQMLDQLINQTIIHSEIPFKLGPNVLNFIIKMFHLFDYSTQSIQHLIKYILFEHYYSNPLSILCQPISKLKKFIKKLDNNQLELLRSSPLVASFESSLDGKDFKKSLINNMEELQSSHNQFVSHLRVLVKLVNQSSGDRINLQQLYINVLNKSFDFKQVTNPLNKLSQTQWNTVLRNCFADNSLNDETLPLIKALKSCHNELCDLIITQQDEPQVVLERVDISSLKDKLSNLKTRSQWKETINPVSKSKVLSKFEIWKRNTLASIENVLINSTMPTSHPLSEAIFFNDYDLLKRHNFVVPRNDIQKALNNPSLIFNKSDSSTTSISRQSVPDLCLLFILYQESHSLINMYDWFTVFKSENEELLGPKRKKTENTSSEDKDPSVVVLFLNAVSDFEYIGLVQPAKRKTDHLTRLVWF